MDKRLDDVQRQFAAAQQAVNQRLYLLAAGLLDGAATILRQIHEDQQKTRQ